MSAKTAKAARKAVRRKASFANSAYQGPSFQDISPRFPPSDVPPVEPISRSDKPKLKGGIAAGAPYPAPTPANAKMRTQGEPSISTERVTMSVRMRFNPLRGLTPDRLSQYLDQFDIGFFRQAAIAWDKIERRDTTLKAVAPKRKKAVARHGYDVLTMDKLEDSQKEMAEAQQKALKYFYDNLTATDAVRPDQRGGMNLLVRQMMDAQSKYFAVHEIVWQPKAQGLTAQFVFCPLWWFEAVTGKLRYLDNEFQVYGRDMAPSEWMVTVGEGYMEACAVAWMFKHLSLQDWVAFCEKFGTPFVDAATSASPGTPEWDALVDYVRNFGPDGGGVRSQGAVIELMEPKATAADTFKMMIENMDRAMTIIWRGGDLGTTGKKDATGASLQGDESDILEGDDSTLIEETLALNVSRFVISWMFGPDAPVLASLKFKQEQDPEAVAFQRTVYTAFLQDGTVCDVLANQTDLKKLTQDVGLAVNEEYTDPYLPVVDKSGAKITGDVVRDPENDIVGGDTEEPPKPAMPPGQPGVPNQPGVPQPGQAKPEVANDAGPDLTKLEDNGQVHFATALAHDLQIVAEDLRSLLAIDDDRILAQRAVAFADRLDALKKDILHLPKSAQALAEVQIAALFTGLTEAKKDQANQ